MCSIVRIVGEKRELLEITWFANLLGVVVGSVALEVWWQRMVKFNLKSFHQPWLGVPKKKTEVRAWSIMLLDSMDRSICWFPPNLKGWSVISLEFWGEAQVYAQLLNELCMFKYNNALVNKFVNMRLDLNVNNLT